jgi:hypothetical protein
MMRASIDSKWLPQRDKKKKEKSMGNGRTGNLSLSFLSFPAGVKLRIRTDEEGNEAILDP